MPDKPPRNKHSSGYTRLNDDNEEEGTDSEDIQMHHVVAASSAAASKRRLAARQTRYVDDPAEEDSLLGGQDDYDAAEQGREVEPLPRSQSPKVQVLKQRSTPKDKSRTIPFRPPDKLRNSFPPNTVRNQKYNMFTFLPLVFYEQFKFFFNLYFLLVALSQFIPALKIGFILTYIAPLAFVLFVTMGKEAYDDYKRHQRDREANSQKYLILDSTPFTGQSAQPSNLYTRSVPSSALKVGDLVHLEKNQRVPADMVLLRTSDASGSCFVRTDQLDGETDWKLRIAVSATQKLETEKSLLSLDAEIYGRWNGVSVWPCHLLPPPRFLQLTPQSRTSTLSSAHSL
jgi:phospholipid-translocating ATPase